MRHDDPPERTLSYAAAPTPSCPGERFYRRVALAAFCCAIAGPALSFVPLWLFWRYVFDLDRVLTNDQALLLVSGLVVGAPLASGLAGALASRRLPPGGRGGGFAVAAAIVGCAWALLTMCAVCMGVG